jgi:transposase
MNDFGTLKNNSARRYIGLDVHKHYLIALGVDADLNVVLPARRVELAYLESWMKKSLTRQDAVVLEMTTNTWQLYDELSEYAGPVTVVHPPHVALITRSQVMNDKIAASILARLLAKGLLVGIWVPPQEVRELRGLVAQRQKMTRLATQAKNRLHAVIQRHHLKPPAGNLFAKTNNGWWLGLPLGELEKMNLQSDLEKLQFAEKQRARLSAVMTKIASEKEEVSRLLQLPGFGIVTAVTVWAAIGDIRRFAESKRLVGYAGLGTRVHNSGVSTRTGRITKAGRRDLRVALVEAAQVGGQPSSPLEGGAGTSRTAARAQQGDCRHCSQTADLCLACPISPGTGSFRRPPGYRTEVVEIRLSGRKKQSSCRAKRSPICPRTSGCSAPGGGSDGNLLGLKETDPTTALKAAGKESERRPNSELRIGDPRRGFTGSSLNIIIQCISTLCIPCESDSYCCVWSGKSWQVELAENQITL